MLKAPRRRSHKDRPTRMPYVCRSVAWSRTAESLPVVRRRGRHPKVFRALRDRGFDWVTYRAARPARPRPSSREGRGSSSTGAGTTCGWLRRSSSYRCRTAPPRSRWQKSPTTMSASSIAVRSSIRALRPIRMQARPRVGLPAPQHQLAPLRRGDAAVEPRSRCSITSPGDTTTTRTISSVRSLTP